MHLFGVQGSKCFGKSLPDRCPHSPYCVPKVGALWPYFGGHEYPTHVFVIVFVFAELCILDPVQDE